MRLLLQMGPQYRRTVAELGEMGQRIEDGASEGLGVGVKIAAGNTVSNYLSGQYLKRRTGLMAKTVDGWLEGRLEGVVGIPEGSPAKSYAWLLGDEEKTITAKKGKFLAIPAGENLTPSGVARYSSPREVPDGFFVRTSRQLLFGRRNGKRGKFRLLFVLVPSVFIQGTGALYDGVFESLDDISGAMENGIAKRMGA